MEKPRVSVVSSKDYREAARAVEQAVDLTGGITDIVKPGNIVLIKPNLVVARDGESGNVTHFSLVEQLVQMCHEAGATEIFVGDGSGNTDTSRAMVSSGIKRAIDKLHSQAVPVKFRDLNYDKNPDTNKFDAISLGTSDDKRTYRIAHSVLVSDVVISVPKMKSHDGTGITIALKNMIGVAPGGYYGFPKKRGRIESLPHTSLEYTKNPKDPLAMYNVICQTILDLNKIALGVYAGSRKKKKYLAVVDGVVAGSYDKINSTFEVPLWRPIKAGTIIAGTDPVAVDTIASRVMCYNPEKIPLIVRAAKIRLGTMTDIEVAGEQVEDVRSLVPPSDNWLHLIDPEIPYMRRQILYQHLAKHVSKASNLLGPYLSGHRKGGAGVNPDKTSMDKILDRAYKIGFETEKKYGGCSQTTLAAIQETLGLQNESLFKAATPFYGGIANTGEGPCGSFSGGLMAIGYVFGRGSNFRGSPVKAQEIARKLRDRFVDEYGTFTCKGVQEKIFGRSFNLLDDKEAKKFIEAGAHKDKCTNVVGKAAQWAVELILSEKDQYEVSKTTHRTNRLWKYVEYAKKKLKIV